MHYGLVALLRTFSCDILAEIVFAAGYSGQTQRSVGSVTQTMSTSIGRPIRQ